MKKLDAIILAGGLGTRLRSVLPGVPKPLAPVNKRPFLDILLEQLAAFSGVGRVVLAVGYRAEAVIAEYSGGNPYGFEILFSIEKKPMGTGGAIKRALELTEGRDVLVMNGDSYAELDLGAFYAFHKRRKSLFTLALWRAPDAGRSGRVEVGARGRVLRFEEKAPGGGPGLVNAGVYLAARSVFDRVKDGVKVSLEREILPALAGRGIYGYVTAGRFIDIGLPETYLAAGKYLKGI